MIRELKPKPEWMNPVFSWEQHAITVNGYTMCYIDEGPRNARPVLLLHGNPTWGFLYRDFVEPLKNAGYRVIVPDWIGAGFSDKPIIDARLTFSHHIADLVSLMDQLKLRGFVIIGQDWGGPQGVGAALQRVERLSAMILMNTWLFTGYVGRFHSSPRPWTSWHAPLIGQFFMKCHKVLSHAGPSLTSKKGLTQREARAYHYIYDEPDSDGVVLTWPRTIPMKEGDRGFDDMFNIEKRLPELKNIPTLLLWAPEDNVFTIEYCTHLKELLPNAEGPVLFDKAAHFLQDDRGPDLAKSCIEFLNRTVGTKDKS